MTFSPKQATFLAVAIWATAQIGVVAGFVMFSVNKLDKATALQCRKHDWPASAHMVHMDWCKANNYTTTK